MYEKQEDHIRFFNDFVTHTLDFEALYTSGHWDQVLHHWLMMNIQSEADAQAFEKRLDKVISRMDQDKILGAFAQKAVPSLVQKGKDELLPAITAHLNKRPKAMGELTDTTRQMISSFKILIGDKAPDLVFKHRFWPRQVRAGPILPLKPMISTPPTPFYCFTREAVSCAKMP